MSQYIAQWKDGFIVQWRNLTWSEYRGFKRRLDVSIFDEPMDIALDIYKIVRIDGPDPRFVPAGIPGYICKQQMVNNPFSGRFGDIHSAIEMARKTVTGDYLLSAKAIIAATLNYKPEEIDNWDPNIFFVRLAQAEVASGRTFEPVNPEAPKTSSTIPDQFKLKKNLSTTQVKALDRTRKDRTGKRDGG